MLQLSSAFINRPIMSLRTGGEVAVITRAIINPNNLKIEGFYCHQRSENKDAILLTQDIRDIVRQGFVVDDAEVLSQPNELIRLKKTLEIDFELEGKPVITQSKEKIGKVTDWATETSTFYIQKLYVGRNLFKSFSQGQLSVDRTQIVEITNRKIVIHEILKGKKSEAPAAVSAA